MVKWAKEYFFLMPIWPMKGGGFIEKKIGIHKLGK
jgi:hypothetical protein